MDRGNQGRIAPTNHKYGCASVSPVNDEPIALSGLGTAKMTVDEVGLIDVKAIAYDAAGNSGSTELTIAAIDGKISLMQITTFSSFLYCDRPLKDKSVLA